jgi:hypothetical protein
MNRNRSKMSNYVMRSLCATSRRSTCGARSTLIRRQFADRRRAAVDYLPAEPVWSVRFDMFVTKLGSINLEFV